MQSPFLQKTILAVAIAAASAHAAAITVDVTSGPFVKGVETIDFLTMTGTINNVVPSPGDADVVELEGTTINGDVTNNATIRAEGDYATGIDFDVSDGGMPTSARTVNGGSLVNNGQISVVGISSIGILLDGAIIDGDFINAGIIKAEGAAGVELGDEGVKGLELGNAEVNGSLINSGEISAVGDGSFGVDIYTNSLDPDDRLVFVGGDIKNTASGKISATGAGSHGINISSLDFGKLSGGEIVSGGNIINQGSISLVGTSSDALQVEETHFNTLNNSGTISAKGEQADAVDIEDARFKQLINSGTISVEGATADAVTIERSTFDDIINTGTISAAGADADAVELDGGSIKRLENKGTIVATGDAGSTAILIAGNINFELPGPDEYASRGIVNSGTIKADGVAIKVESSSQPFFQINHKDGLIEGGVAAIDAKERAVLNWTGGTIRGDVLDVSEINSGGNNTFDGNVMRAPFLDLYEGTLTLQKPHSELQGTLEMSSTSALEMLIGNSTDNTKPVFNVTGGAEFESGSKIKLTPRPDDFASSTPEKNYVLVKTGSSIDNKGLSVQSTSALLDVKSFNVSSNSVEAVVAAKSDQAVIDTVKTGGGDQNAQRAQVAFAKDLMSKLNPNDPVYKAFANATTDEQLAALAKQLSPQTNGGATQGAMAGQSAITGAIGSRNSAGRGASTGDVLQEKGLWLQALHSDADQDMRDGIAGYDADSKGIAIGADGKLNEQTTIGLAYSYLDTDVRSDDGNKTQVDSHALTAYASWQDGPWFVDGSLTYGVNDNESMRYVAGTEAKGDYDSDLVGVNALAGYVYRLNDTLLLEPRVAARYSNVDIDSYREKGSAAALDVGAARFEVGELGAGVRMAGAFALGQGTLEPEAKLMAYHDVIGDKTDSTSSFTLGGTPFVTNGASPVRDSYEAGVGVTYKLGALSVGASYDYLGKTDFNADTFNAKVRYDF